MNKDVVNDKYGRLYELPCKLSAIGLDLQVFCLNYCWGSADLEEGEDEISGVEWNFKNFHISISGFFECEREMLRKILAFGPDLIIGSSDCFNVVLACRLAKKLNIPFVSDLYDNYESFGMARIPFVRFLYKRALKSASAIICVSEPLGEYVREQLGEGVKTLVPIIESTIIEGAFAPRDAQTRRAKLSLPADKPLVGYAGALDSSRDIEVLYLAFERLKHSSPEAELVLAGVSNGSTPVPQGPDIHYFGALSHEDVADLYSALNVGVICLKDSDFGRYAFPQKAYEMISVRIPLAVTNVGAMGKLLDSYPSVLYEAGDAEDLTRVLQSQLEKPVIVDMDIPTWEDQAKKMKAVLEDVVARGRL